MIKLTRYAFALLLLGLLAAPEALAQAQFKIGPRVTYDIDRFDAFAVGGDVRLSSVALPVDLKGSFDYFFNVDSGSSSIPDVKVWQADVNAIYSFFFDNQLFTPYAGAGVGITRVNNEVDGDVIDIDESTTKAGLNVLGGAVFGFGGLRPFVEARVTFGDFDSAALTGGLLFSLGN